MQVGTAKGGRVLVVDDDPMVRDTLRQMLADEGYVVDAATDGSDALACVHAARPDAILLDLMMPGMNGRQFLDELRAAREYAHVPVLIMTAVHGLELNLPAIGASEVVEKPFDIDELLNKVALAVYRAREAEPQATGPLPVTASEAAPPRERGVVLIVEHDRARLQQLDVALSERGFTVVSMTRALSQLARMARALRPRAVLVELDSAGSVDLLRGLRAAIERDPISVLVYSRGEIAPSRCPEALVSATDAALVAFVEQQPA
jgi:DNA-binding response OmpR family regulator